MWYEQRQIENGQDERSPGETLARQQVGDRRSAEHAAERGRGRGESGEAKRVTQFGIGNELPNAGGTADTYQTGERRDEKNQEE